MNSNDRALLLGMLLGDGCLKTKHHIKQDGSNSTYYEYVLCHSIKQEDYLKHKLDLFHSIMGGKKPTVHHETSKLGQSCRFSKCHKSFRLLHKTLYKLYNRKYITRQVLNWLSPQSIALWYMDDGGLKSSYRPDGSVSSCQMILSTYCSGIEADIIINWFKEVWNINCKKLFHKKSSSYYLSFNTTEGRKLDDLIKPYMIPSMLYKLPSHRITRVRDILRDDDIV